MGKRKAEVEAAVEDNANAEDAEAPVVHVEPPVVHIEACLEEAREILDLTIEISDQEVPPATRDEFREELVAAAGSITTAHDKVKDALRKTGWKGKRRKGRA